MVLLLWRSRRQDRRRSDSVRQAGHVQLHAARAAGCRRRHHSVEFPVAAPRVEARAGPCRRQYRGREAVRVHLGIDTRVHEADRSRGISAGRGQVVPVTAQRSARRSSSTRSRKGRFTGSDATGQKIYESAAGPQSVSMELAASANIVFAIASRQPVKARSRHLRARSDCIAGSRSSCSDDTHRFVEKLVALGPTAKMAIR